MKWNLIKLLCEYSDDFSSESFKDLVDSIDMKHLFGNRLRVIVLSSGSGTISIVSNSGNLHGTPVNSMSSGDVFEYVIRKISGGFPYWVRIK